MKGTAYVGDKVVMVAELTASIVEKGTNNLPKSIK
jgi:hypothetical protein